MERFEAIKLLQYLWEWTQGTISYSLLQMQYLYIITNFCRTNVCINMPNFMHYRSKKLYYGDQLKHRDNTKVNSGRVGDVT